MSRFGGGGAAGDRLRRVLELQLQVTGQQGLDDINGKIKRNADLIDVLGQQYSQSVISGEQYRASVTKLIAENDKLTAGLELLRKAREQADYQARAAAGQLTIEELAIEELQAQAVDTASAMDRLAAAKGRANASSGALGRGVLDLSRAIEDMATGGAVGGLNNLPGIFGNFGFAVGLTLAQINPLVTVVTVLGTGAYMLSRNWDTLTSAFGSGKAETEAQEFERLSKAVERTTGEMLRLNQLEDARKGKSKVESAVERLRDAKGPDAEAVSRFVDSSLGRAGGLDKLLAGLADVAVAMERNSNPTATADDLKALRIKMQSSDPKINPIAEQFGQAALGDRKQLDALIGFARNANNKFAVGPNFQASPFIGEFVRLFETEGPDAQRSKAALQARLKQMAEAEKAKREQAKAAKDRENAQIDAMNDQGLGHTAEVKRILDAQKDAKQAAAKASKEAARNLSNTLNATGKVADEQQKAAQVADLTARFARAGFDQQYAQHGANLARDRINKGEPAQHVLDSTYQTLLKMVAMQERNQGIVGEATMRLAQLEQRLAAVAAMQGQVVRQLQRGRNRRPTLLPDPAQR